MNKKKMTTKGEGRGVARNTEYLGLEGDVCMNGDCGVVEKPKKTRAVKGEQTRIVQVLPVPAPPPKPPESWSCAVDGGSCPSKLPWVIFCNVEGGRSKCERGIEEEGWAEFRFSNLGRCFSLRYLAQKEWGERFRGQTEEKAFRPRFLRLGLSHNSFLQSKGEPLLFAYIEGACTLLFVGWVRLFLLETNVHVVYPGEICCERNETIQEREEGNRLEPASTFKGPRTWKALVAWENTGWPRAEPRNPALSPTTRRNTKNLTMESRKRRRFVTENKRKQGPGNPMANKPQS